MIEPLSKLAISGSASTDPVIAHWMTSGESTATVWRPDGPVAEGSAAGRARSPYADFTRSPYADFTAEMSSTIFTRSETSVLPLPSAWLNFMP